MAIAKVRDNGTGQFTNVASTTTFAFTMSSAYSAGDCIIVSVMNNAGGTATLTDNLGNTYTSLNTANTANSMRTSLFVCFSAAAGTATVTVTVTAVAQYCLISVSEYSGLAGSADKTASATGTTSTTASTGTTAATTSASELVACCIGVYTTPVQSQTATTPAGYTALPSVNSTATNNFMYLIPFFQIVSATGTQSASTTLGFAPTDSGGVIATIAAAAIVDPYPKAYSLSDPSNQETNTLLRM